MDYMVTIITPCYNGEAFLPDYFKAILDQKYTNIELILVNDGSDDNTDQIVEEYMNSLLEKGIRFIYLKKSNGGAASAINLGLRYVSGKYLSWIDVDDRIHPDYVNFKAAYLEKNEAVDILITNSNYVYFENGQVLKRAWSSGPKDKNDLITRLLLCSNFGFEPGNFMVRTNSFVGLLPSSGIFEGEKKMVGQNIQLLLPIIYSGNYAFEDIVLYNYYIHDKNHHTKFNSIQIMLVHIEWIERVFQETINSMNCPDSHEMITTVKIGCEKQRLTVAAKYGDASLGRKSFDFLKKNGEVDKKDAIKFIISQSRILSNLYRK